jgi:predicted transcriptional regulator
MQEKLTILVSAEHKKFIKRYARKHNKSVSRFIDDMLSTIKRQSVVEAENDEWIEKTAGAYHTGKKDILKELFKGISV